MAPMKRSEGKNKVNQKLADLGQQENMWNSNRKTWSHSSKVEVNLTVEFRINKQNLEIVEPKFGASSPSSFHQEDPIATGRRTCSHFAYWSFH